MKKLIVIALVIVGMASFAQEKSQRTENGKRAEMEKFTPEQRNQIRIKRLTLKLDLNASQQKEISQILSEADSKREAAKAAYKAQKDSNKKLTKEERFAMVNKMLDEQIAFKQKIQKVLNPEQMAKWEKMQENRKFAKSKIKNHRKHGSVEQK